jgi:hypothetical protein
MVSQKGSINNEKLKEWRQKVYSVRPNHIYLNSHIKRPNNPSYKTIITLDSATPHRNSEFKKTMAINYDTNVVIIPGGMTPILQPADVSWNRSLKSNVNNYWVQWFDAQTCNLEDKVKRPSYKTVAEWCLNAWNELDRQLIIKS